MHEPLNLRTRNIQGDVKVLDKFVFGIYSKSLGAQHFFTARLKQRFMWICEKNQFGKALIWQYYFFCAPKDLEYITKTNVSRTFGSPCRSHHQKSMKALV
jgi:hypothetical protein